MLCFFFSCPVAFSLTSVSAQHVPRVGFKAKKKELADFKAAIEMYEADPEMNPMTIVQVMLPPSLSLLKLHYCLFVYIIMVRLDSAHISRLNEHFDGLYAMLVCRHTTSLSTA